MGEAEISRGVPGRSSLQSGRVVAIQIRTQREVYEGLGYQSLVSVSKRLRVEESC